MRQDNMVAVQKGSLRSQSTNGLVKILIALAARISALLLFTPPEYLGTIESSARCFAQGYWMNPILLHQSKSASNALMYWVQFDNS